MRSLLLLFVFATTIFASPSLVVAQETASVRAVRIVVPTARGRRKYGGKKLTKALRKTLRAEVGAVVSARSFRDAQRRLGLSGKKKWSRANIARAGREVGADYVLYTRISRKGWLYTAQARLVNTATDEVQMDFRSQYYDPNKDTGDRGIRIANRTLLKMQTLAEEGRLLATGGGATAQTSTPPIGFSATAGQTGATSSDPARPPELVDPADPGPGQRDTTGDLRSEQPRASSAPPAVATLSPAETSRSETALPRSSLVVPDDPEDDLKSDGLRDDGWAYAAPPAQDAQAPVLNSAAAATPTPDATVAAPTAVRPETDDEFLRIDISGGAGLLRRYDVSSANVGDSGLSYPLDPTSLLRAGVDLLIPKTSLGFDIDFAFRPVQYEVGPVGQPAETPSGMLINTAVWVNYQVPLAGAGRQAIRLIPRIGGRLDTAPVDSHPGNFVIPATSITVVGGVGVRWPINRTLEVSAAIDGGWIASYSEERAVSGDGGTGFSVGGDLDVRIWLSSMIGIAFDTQYRFAQVNFDGLPTRQVPNGETGQLENLTVSTQDLLTSVGMALRF